MRAKLLTVGLFVGLFAACGGGNSGGAPVTCGTITCKAHEVCSTTSSSPTCACATGYIGSSCSACAAGYQMTNGVCILSPIDCSRSTVCGGHGTCANSTCTCSTGYTGTACGELRRHLQDNDKNGTCLPTCLNATTMADLHAAADLRRHTSGARHLLLPAGLDGDRLYELLGRLQPPIERYLHHVPRQHHRRGVCRLRRRIHQAVRRFVRAMPDVQHRHQLRILCLRLCERPGHRYVRQVVHVQ